MLLHGLPELFPDPSFCFRDRKLTHTWPASAVSGGFLLQLDSIPYFRSPPPDLGIVATTGTEDLIAMAPNSCVNAGSKEHGSIELPLDLVKALPEVGVKDLPDRCSQQTLTMCLGLPGLFSFLLSCL